MRESFSSLRQLEYHDNDIVRVYNNTQTDDYPAHWNNAFEIIVPVENSYEVCINDVIYDVRKGEVLIIPAGTVHEIFAPDCGRRYIIMVEPRLFCSVDGLSAVQHCFYPCVHLRYDRHGELLEEVHDYLSKVVQGYESEQYFGRPEARLWLSLVFVKVARSLLEVGVQDVPDSHRQQAMSSFLDVCSYIAEHCAQKLTLEDVASYSGYSKYHFARMFKAYAGISFYDFFLRQRVLLCEQLLADPQIPVTEVALRCGFGSIATFNRIFKQYEKMTPTEYRRLRQLVLSSADPAEKTAISEK